MVELEDRREVHAEAVDQVGKGIARGYLVEEAGHRQDHELVSRLNVVRVG